MKQFDEIMLMPEFIEFMDENTPELKNYWEKILQENPDLLPEFEKAVIFHGALSKHKLNSIPGKNIELSTQLLNDKLRHYDTKQYYSVHKHLKIRLFRKIAAVLILLLVSFIIIHFISQQFNNSSQQFYEVIVPSGEKTMISLPDSTLIWLNSESILKYPVSYNSVSRDVYLTGEGYFEVNKNKSKKFTVHTDNIDIVALGTKFNVKSYPDEHNIEATLVEGSIRVIQTGSKNSKNEIILKPEQKLVFYKKNMKKTVENISKEPTLPNSALLNETMTVRDVNSSNVVGWKDHLLVFDNEKLDEIAVKLSRWYKMDISIQDHELSNHRFTGKFVHNETILQVLEAINLTTPIKYNIIENQILVFESN